MSILCNAPWKKNRALTRLSLAFETGLPQPDGPVAALHPEVGFDMVGLNDALIVQPFFVSNLAWKNQGFHCDVTLPTRRFALVIVCCKRSKQQTADLIAQAATQADIVVVDGQKTDGIDSHYKNLRKLTDVQGTITKGHGRLFWFAGTDLPSLRAVDQNFDGFVTKSGVFSVGAVDPASALLADALPEHLSGDVADLGAGWGYLSSRILSREAVAQLDIVEADFFSLDCAKQNVIDPRASFHWADATTWNGSYDAVVMNPPFHISREGEPELGRVFISSAKRCLKSKGTLYLVANRHLPYETALEQCFGKVVELPGNGCFKLFHASRPKRK
jgi:16S rRNA (guanine1207-N2)-methyltransferase